MGKTEADNNPEEMSALDTEVFKIFRVFYLVTSTAWLAKLYLSLL